MMLFTTIYTNTIINLKTEVKLRMKESIIDKIVIDTKINLRRIKEKINANVNGKLRTKQDRNK